MDLLYQDYLLLCGNSPCDRFLLVQELIAGLAQVEGVAAIEYPVWSPYDAHASAVTLLKLLEQEKASTP